MSAKFESQNGSISDGPDDQALEQLLRSLDGADNSFASLTMPDGSYLQAGGGPDEFTVEVRLFPPGLPLRHLKAGMTGGQSKSGERRLSIGGAEVSVPLNQVFGLSTVCQIFRHFLHGHGLDPSVEWHDITSMFAVTATRPSTDASFACLVHAVAHGLSGLGFKARGKEKFVRKRGQLEQHVTLSVRKDQGSAYVAPIVGFTFPDLQKAAAQLKGTEPRPGWSTSALNLGLLTPNGRYAEWPLPGEEGAASLASTVLGLITTYAVPYWDRYSTFDDLVKHFAAGDPVLCRGDWQWDCAAACVQLGRPGEAIDCLRRWSEQASGETARRVKAAITHLSPEHKE
jgi:hypothetical protein